VSLQSLAITGAIGCRFFQNRRRIYPITEDKVMLQNGRRWISSVTGGALMAI
jgi:hypothetical protein